MGREMAGQRKNQKRQSATWRPEGFAGVRESMGRVAVAHRGGRPGLHRNRERPPDPAERARPRGVPRSHAQRVLAPAPQRRHRRGVLWPLVNLLPVELGERRALLGAHEAGEGRLE